MKCTSCSTPMQLSKTESSATSSAEWYKCPCCGRARMTTRRKAAGESHFSALPQTQRYARVAGFR